MIRLLRHFKFILCIGHRQAGFGRNGSQIGLLLASVGLAAGSATLIVVLAVMNGFQFGFIEDILEIGSYHLRITASSADSHDYLVSRIRKVEGIVAVVPFYESSALIKGNAPRSRGISLRIVPPNVRDIDSGFARHVEMVAGDFFIDASDGIVIGAELASHLRISVGQEVSIMTLDEADIFDTKGILNPTHKRFVVQGIFRSGFYQYDLGWAFIGAPSTLRVGAVPIYGIKIADRFRDEFSSIALHNMIEATGNSAEIESWRVYNRALFSALRMEKLLLSTVLGLVFLVVTYNILQALKRQVLERSSEIGLLRALGTPPWVVRGVFIWEGTLLGIVGATVGTALGLLIACNVDLLFSLLETVANIALALLNQLPDSLFRVSTEQIRIFSPDTFYLLEIPVRLPLIEVLLIAAFTIVAPALSGLAAAMKTLEIDIIAGMRAE